MKYEKSCGCLVVNQGKVLMIQHNEGHWDFPKGHMEVGESEEDTALREVKEETNINVVLDSEEPFLLVKNYLRDYDIVDGTIQNRLVNTYYFTGVTNSDDIEYFHQTKLEKQDSLRGFFIDKEEAIELLKEYNEEDEKAKYLAIETLEVLNRVK